MTEPHSTAPDAPAALPFAGEVLELVPGQEEWRVAVETVVAPFARTMLVPEHLYRKVADAVKERLFGAPASAAEAHLFRGRK